MLESIDLSRNLSKDEFKQEHEALTLRLAALQRQVLDLRIPVLVVVEGWDAAGKGTLINALIQPLDPRGFTVQCGHAPTTEEQMHPFLWRFWTRTPARGRIVVFDRSWYRCVLHDRVDGNTKGRRLEDAYRDITAFERQLTDDGTVVIKLFLHISKKEQKRRLRELEANACTAWRVTREDWRRHKAYDAYLKATDAALAHTDSPHAPWTVVEAEHRRYATLKAMRTLEARLKAAVERAAAHPRGKARPGKAAGQAALSILGRVNPARKLDEAAYRRRVDRCQEELRTLEHEIYRRRRPVVIVYEGWDAAGKGGNIRRLTQNLDPRGYEVVPISAPNDIEKAHHYLWRFWTHMPKDGHITVFDRSWYGRVLVERIEGFCAPEEWQRAYREINEMEQHLVSHGAVLCKFWLHIDPAEQLRRFRERSAIAAKRWKITDEDWRNRKKWKRYEAAVEEMLARTSPPTAPWTIVESNCKRFARIKVMDTVIQAIRHGLKR